MVKVLEWFIYYLFESLCLNNYFLPTKICAAPFLVWPVRDMACHCCTLEEGEGNQLRTYNGMYISKQRSTTLEGYNISLHPLGKCRGSSYPWRYLKYPVCLNLGPFFFNFFYFRCLFEMQVSVLLVFEFREEKIWTVWIFHKSTQRLIYLRGCKFNARTGWILCFKLTNGVRNIPLPSRPICHWILVGCCNSRLALNHHHWTLS